MRMVILEFQLFMKVGFKLTLKPLISMCWMMDLKGTLLDQKGVVKVIEGKAKRRDTSIF